MGDYIASPRPIFREEEEKAVGSLSKTHTCETAGRHLLSKLQQFNNTITIGGITSGIVVKISKKGLEINGYYAGLTDRVKYANIRKFSLISWEDLDKMRTEVFEKKKKKQKMKTRVCVIDKPDKEYLKKLPIVTLNGKKYYMDMERKERRSVDYPEKVYGFEGLATKKPA